MAYNPMSSEEIRAKIIEEARRLFMEKGIDATEMKEIAQAAGIGRSTLYRYFTQKEQLAFIVTSDALHSMLVDSFSVAIEDSLCGYDKLEKFCYHYVSNLVKHVSILSYLSEFDKLFERDYPDIPEARDYLHGIQKKNDLLANYIREGQRDGSIVPYENPNIISSVLLQTILGVGQRVLVRTDHYLEEHGFSGLQIISKSVELLLRTLKT